MRDDLLLIKAHFFFLFAALGPILPFLSVIGKQFGISEVVMGSIFSIVPVFYFLAKTLYGYVVDYFVSQRTLIFTSAVILMGISYLLIYFVPHTPLQKKNFTNDVTCSSLIFCNLHKHDSPNWTVNQVCDLTCLSGPKEEGVELRLLPEYCRKIENVTLECNVSRVDCRLNCKFSDPLTFASPETLYKTSQFWIFVALLALGSVGFNIVSSASDAICFNALGEGNEEQYGNQRLWGTVGYGITAFSAGYLIDYVSKGATSKNNTPAFVLLMFFISLDIIVCSRLKFPPIPQSQKIAKEAYEILRKPYVMIFAFFALIIGMCDGFLVYYLFWFMEQVAAETELYHKIRFIEGLTILVESFGGELIVFPLSGEVPCYCLSQKIRLKLETFFHILSSVTIFVPLLIVTPTFGRRKIAQKIGYDTSLSLCFMFFAIRLIALSFIPSPWWVLPIEAVLHGFTYALSYSTIVGYVSRISSPRIQGTMQGIISGIYDGFGYALGSFFGGILCTMFSLREIFRIFGTVAFTAGILYYLLHITYIHKKVHLDGGVVYVVPEDSSKVVTPSES